MSWGVGTACPVWPAAPSNAGATVGAAPAGSPAGPVGRQPLADARIANSKKSATRLLCIARLTLEPALVEAEGPVDAAGLLGGAQIGLQVAAHRLPGVALLDEPPARRAKP